MKNSKLRISKGLFLLNGITSIFIGLTHTYAHYAELVSDALQDQLEREIVVMGTASNVWSLWQGMSLMMGVLLIIVGLISVLIIVNLKENEFPPVNISVVIILMLLMVVYSGIEYFGAGQVYGGIVGIIIQSISIIFSKLKKSEG